MCLASALCIQQLRLVHPSPVHRSPLISIQDTEVFLHRSILREPARLTTKSFLERFLNPVIPAPTHLFLDEFASSVLDGFLDNELLILSLVYWYSDTHVPEPERSLETRRRLLQSLESSTEFYAMCDIICGLYNERVADPMTKDWFKAKLRQLLSHIDSCLGCYLLRLFNHSYLTAGCHTQTI